MRTFHYKRNAHFCPSINVDRLWSMVPEGVYEKAKTDSNMAPVIDVTKLVSLVIDYQLNLIRSDHANQTSESLTLTSRQIHRATSKC